MNRRFKGPAPPTPKRLKKDASNSYLSIVASFDDLVRESKILSEGSAEEEFLHFVSEAQDWRRRWASSELEVRRLKSEVSQLLNDLSLKDLRVRQAQDMVQKEMKRRLSAEDERDALKTHLGVLKDFVLGEREINDETREKVRHIEKSVLTSGTKCYKSNAETFLSPQHHTANNNHTVEETVESILDVSQLSYDEPLNNMNTSRRLTQNGVPRRGPRRSSANKILDESRTRRRSAARACEGERIVATTTVTVLDGQPHAESIIETQLIDTGMDKFEERAKKSRRSRDSRRVTYNDQHWEQEFEPSAPPAPLCDMEQDLLLKGPQETQQPGVVLSPLSPHDLSPCGESPCYQQQQQQQQPPQHPIKRTFSNAGANRMHYLVRKKLFREEDCGPCGGKIKIGRSRYKCRDCGTTVHINCKDTIPLPCVPASLTPVKPGYYISDYTPPAPPMIPALLIHCLREIEARGLTEVGLYRVSGSEKEAQELLDKFLRNKGAPSLTKYELGAITSCVKKFLRSLKEPLVPQSLWKRFVEASTNPDTTDVEAAVVQCIVELPRPNRDTMAFLILHFQKIAASPETKMCVENIARIFGPTIVGYSSADPTAMLSETPLQKNVMSALLNISSDYWKTFVNVADGGTPSATVSNKYVATPEGGYIFNTPGTFRAPSERKSKKFKSLHASRQIFQSPMI